MPLSPASRVPLDALPLYIPGRHDSGGDIPPAVLSANENPLGPSPLARRACHAAMATLHRYPNPTCSTLRRAIAARYALDEEQIICGAGSDELIALLARLFAGPGDEVLYSRHGFMMYPIAAGQVGATPVAAPETGLRTDVDALLAHVTDKTRLLFLANPNNPTGSYISTAELNRLADGLRPDILLVVDSAYAEYADAADYDAGAAMVEARPNVVMLRTFSKIHALAALRVGWAYGPAAIIAMMNKMRGPFNVNAPGQAAAIAALGDDAHIARSRRHNALWRGKLTAALTKMGYDVAPSQGNFLLIDFAAADRAKQACDFLQRQRVLVRMMAAVALPDHLRVTVGTASECRRFLTTLQDFRG